jgi:hypothetical protein
VAIKGIVACIGENASSIPVLHGIGIYSYSFSSFLISSLLCGAIPVDWVQWTLIGYSALTSIMFLVSTYWADLSTQLSSRRRMMVIAGICAVQLSLLLVFKLYFFHHVSPKHDKATPAAKSTDTASKSTGHK